MNPRSILLAILVLALTPAAHPQDLVPMAPTADPSFEVAVIQPADPASHSDGFHLNGHSILIENQSVTSLIMFAYAINQKQTAGAPAWFSTEHFDIHGVPDAPGQPSLHQYQLMVQKLLASRFNLKFHRDKRELSIYAITVAKGGPKLKPSASAPTALSDENGYGRGSSLVMKFTNSSMADFVLNMQYVISSRPVVDQTGLTGHYDFTLTFTPDQSRLGEPNAAPGLFTAIQEQLGLKLDATKGLAEVLIIDHAERPSAN